MKKKTKPIFITAVLLVSAAVIATLLFRTPSSEQVTDAVDQNEESVASVGDPIAAQKDSSTAATTPQPVLTEDNHEQVAATRRMYMAHAPLRTPEVADPDSGQNRVILETMVTKALQRSRPSELTSGEGQ